MTPPERRKDAAEEKPLRVRVAEALGCQPVEYDNVFGRNAWACECPGSNRGEAHGDLLSVYHYDTDWSATGPFIERYEIALEESGCGYTPDQKWLARAWYYAEVPQDREYGGRWAEAEARGGKPLTAVCNLILVLHEAGQLRAALSEDAKE
jgi:hypothetical protein